MSLINYVKREEATGHISEIYDNLEKEIKAIPNVVQFYTASPDFFGKLMSIVGHFNNHHSLDAITITYIRMLISSKEDATYCINLQSGILRSIGIPESDLDIARKDYTNVNLSEKEKALVCFVMDQMFGKLTDTKARIDQLKQLDWTEKDIFEVSVMGAIQKGMVNVIKSFEVELDF